MALFVALDKESGRRTFAIFFALCSLLPLLIVIFFIFYYLLPVLKPDQIDNLKDTFIYALSSMFLFPSLCFLLMSRWMRSLEALTKEIKAKSIQVTGKKEEIKEENEIITLKHLFNELYCELQDKISRLSEYSDNLIDSSLELSALAITDALTTLYNRRHFDLLLAEETNRAKRYNLELSLIMIDIDDFKEYNDSLGHQAGDNLLRDLGLLIRKSLRKSDIAFRYGGDEFAIILPGCGIKEAEVVSNNLANIISDYQFDDLEETNLSKMTISCGVTCYAQSSNLEEFVRKADSLLFKAKGAGKGFVMC
ncbi:MAG: GGDEF domain-containing protein [Thermodesulfobacteriota bacterium]|nr:GGDEF domain-containing protein [Thermodesulfobacteriota bacterium]